MRKFKAMFVLLAQITLSCFDGFFLFFLFFFYFNFWVCVLGFEFVFLVFLFKTHLDLSSYDF